MVTVILIIFLVFWAIFEFAAFLTYGTPLGKGYSKLMLESLSFYTYLNPYNSEILGSREGFPYISKVGVSILWKYHVNGVGTVWRWSKLSKAIDNKYKEILLQKLTPNN